MDKSSQKSVCFAIVGIHEAKFRHIWCDTIVYTHHIQEPGYNFGQFFDTRSTV